MTHCPPHMDRDGTMPCPSGFLTHPDLNGAGSGHFFFNPVDLKFAELELAPGLFWFGIRLKKSFNSPRPKYRFFYIYIFTTLIILYNYTGAG